MKKSRTDDDARPWDIKRLVLSLGGFDDERGFLTFEVFNDNWLGIYEGDSTAKAPWFREQIPIEAARRLRDFLNYAVPKEDSK
jgi:hypothetical protein